ncbi:phage tail tape measure protein [Pseudomonas asiatica]|uniref:phage tail tape measure protein n=1 Tax=Pseudomonas asiatica TaxID=2219225 RepID=UPI00209B457E|nr:phage tail tape measure protein [Pseudomonas asiatica]MCO7537530.1 phage tail tape measure protein [Pseudomonas asiatica]MCO7551308.1 phage tail tape measure protein [Pseudomonas asiatica]MCO7561848.1 phage tail tape measure protein [Pseudomonas asiatica]
MAKMQLALVIGGAVASSVGAAFKNVEGRISKLEQKGNKAKVLKSTIGETMKLQAEWKRAHDTGAAGADKLLRKLNGNLDSLRKQGVEVGRLSREYQRLAREAKGADLQLKGHQQIDTGRSGLKSNAAAAAVGVGLAAVPTKISADYQAIIRDIAIKADAVNKPEEVQLSRTVIQTAKDTGMGRNDVADLINQLVGAGMELDKAMAYAPTAAKFAVGQGASGVDTASMIMALQQNAKISDPKVMEQALEAIAYQGQAGSFEASDMAKWFPQLLAGMEKNGITGMDSVSSLGAMLQVQMKTAGSSDEAANNFKNWMEKIGSSDVVKAYKDAGIDYQASLNTGLQKGMNVIESSMALAMKYVEATDPAKAKKMKEAQANIDKEVDPEKAKAALEALEKTLRTGDLFADMQVKAALTAYAQNRGLYADLKADSQKATGILDKNLAERRETSSQQWAETAQAVDDAMRSIGDAIRPATDMAAKGLTAVAQGITTLSDRFPAVIMGLAGLAAGISGLLAVRSGAKVARGAFNVARGRAWSARRGGKLDEAPAEAALPKTGNRVLDAGVGVLGKVFGAPASNDPAPGVGSEPLRVFVVNADALGRLGGSVANSGPAEAGSRRARRRRRRAGAMADVRRAPGAPMAGVAALTGAAGVAGEASTLGRMVRSVRGVTRAAGKLPGGKLIDAVPGALDVALNAETKDEKAEGYGGVAGGMAGAMAGAAAGAAIGSVVPLIGTAVGGAIGAALGGLGGESVGGWLGKKWFGEEKPESDQVASAEPAAPTVNEPASVPALPVAGAMPAPVVKDLAPAPVTTRPVAPSKPVDQMTDAEVEQAYAELPNFAQRDLFDGVGGFGGTGAGLGEDFAPTLTLDAKPAKPRPEPPPVDQTQALGMAVRELQKVPQLPPSIAPVVSQVVKGGGEPGAMGDVVRSLVASVQPPAVAAKAVEKAKPEPAKVDQSFTFAPTMPITVHGDVKDPNQIVREAEQALRVMFEGFQREVAARQASVSLFDAADVA